MQWITFLHQVEASIGSYRSSAKDVFAVCSSSACISATVVAIAYDAHKGKPLNQNADKRPGFKEIAGLPSRLSTKANLWWLSYGTLQFSLPFLTENEPYQVRIYLMLKAKNLEAHNAKAVKSAQDNRGNKTQNTNSKNKKSHWTLTLP